MNKSTTWINKYKPKTIADLVLNKKSIYTILSWLKKFDANKKSHYKTLNKLNSKKKKRLKKDTDPNNPQSKEPIYTNQCSCILVTGPHGIGKTISIETILHELNYTIKTVNISSLKNSKSKESYKRALSRNSIINLMNNNTSKHAIIIDRLESMTSNIEKGCLLSILKENDVFWDYPIILISDNTHSKMLKDIKTIAFTIPFYKPFENDMKQIIKKIVMNENIKFSSMAVMKNILDYAQSDVGMLIKILRDLSDLSQNKVITDTLCNNFLENIKKKDVDIDLYNATNKLLFEYNSIDECLRYFESEKVTLPLMIHQYYGNVIVNNFSNKDMQYDLVYKVVDSISTGDIIENIIYGDQSWNMQEIRGFYSCVNTSFHLCHNRTTKDKPKKQALKFTYDFNKMSIRNINKKNIINADKCFKNMNITDYIYINKIFRHLINENNIKDV